METLIIRVRALIRFVWCYSFSVKHLRVTEPKINTFTDILCQFDFLNHQFMIFHKNQVNVFLFYFQLFPINEISMSLAIISHLTSIANIFSFNQIYLGQRLKNRLNKICGRQPLKRLRGSGLFKAYPFNFFKGCLPQILTCPFLNTLSHLIFFCFQRT